jgi:hypothetical protein
MVPFLPRVCPLAAVEASENDRLSYENECLISTSVCGELFTAKSSS